MEIELNFKQFLTKISKIDKKMMLILQIDIFVEVLVLVSLFWFRCDVY